MLKNFIEMEFLKLKRSKMFLISILGSLMVPVLLFFTAYKNKIDGNPVIFSEMLKYTNQYTLALFAIIVIAVLANYLFAREYQEHTLKSIIPLPVSKTEFIVGKFVMYFIWVMVLSVITFISANVLFYLVGATGFTWTLFLKMFKQLIFGSVLLYLTMSPLVFISVWMKNSVATMIASATIVFGNMLVINSEYAPIYPWFAPYLISTGQLSQYNYGTLLPYLVVFATFLIGFFITLIYMYKKDIPL